MSQSTANQKPVGHLVNIFVLSCLVFISSIAGSALMDSIAMDASIKPIFLQLYAMGLGVVFSLAALHIRMDFFGRVFLLAMGVSFTAATFVNVLKAQSPADYLGLFIMGTLVFSFFLRRFVGKSPHALQASAKRYRRLCGFGQRS